MLDNMMRKRTGVLLFSNMISNPEALHRAICQHEEQLQKFFPADDLYWVKKVYINTYEILFEVSFLHEKDPFP